MAISETKIGKYLVTVDSDMGDGATGCWIEYKKFSASLECADATGVLLSPNETEHEMEQAIIDEIRAYADAHGY